MNRLSIFGRMLPLAGLGLMLVALPARAQDYDGFYGVAEGGIGIVKSKGDTIAGPFSSSSDSGVFGGALGYRTQLAGDSRIVLGAEGVMGIYTNGADARYGVYGIGGFQTGAAGLLYGRVGFTWLDDFRTGVGRGINGLTIGGGYEYPIQDRMSVRLDYRYTDFDDINVPDNRVNFTGHEITAGFVLNF